MVSIRQFLEHIVEDLTANFPELKTCVVLPGYLETTELQEVHRNTPGVFIAPVGNGEITHVKTGESDITMQMVLYLLVVDQPGADDGIRDAVMREQVAQDLLTKLLAHMSRTAQRWGLDGAHPAMAIESADVHGLTNNFTPHTKDWRLGTAVLARAADLYGGSDPISQLALWAITWEQKLRLGINELDGESPPEDPKLAIIKNSADVGEVPTDPQLRLDQDDYEPLLEPD